MALVDFLRDEWLMEFEPIKWSLTWLLTKLYGTMARKGNT